MSKYVVEGRFLSALNDFVYDVLFIKADDGTEVCLNELMHNNIKKGAKVSIVINVEENN